MAERPVLITGRGERGQKARAFGILRAMEYQVPQFIEVEDHIVGPLTLKQFIYLAGGAGICVIFIVYLPLVFGILFALPIAGFAAALAFYKINGKPFIDVLESATSYYTGSKLFLWKHEDKKVSQAERQQAATAQATALAAAGAKPAPRLTRGKLSELAWSLDVSKQAADSGQQSR